MQILITCDYYSPGWKAGGPIRSLNNLVECLGDKFDFKVVTRDRDYGDSRPYPGVKINKWQKVEKAEVLYLSPFHQFLWDWFRLLKDTSHDILYLNSFFSPNFTIKPLLLRKLDLSPKVPTLLATRGELSNAALSFKNYKKSPYMVLARALRLYRQLYWQASSEKELADILAEIEHYFGIRVINPIIIPDLTIVKPRVEQNQREKAVGTLRVVFLSRICRMKNLDGALRILKETHGRLEFDVFGPLEDEKYWQECQEIIKSIPNELTVTYRGALSPERVIPTLAGYDLFFLPTLGENYGHVILEALLAGCPILISDRTPWRGLEEKGVGWDIPLDQPRLYSQVIKECMDMDTETHRRWSLRAHEYGRYVQSEANKKSIEFHREMFETIASKYHELQEE